MAGRVRKRDLTETMSVLTVDRYTETKEFFQVPFHSWPVNCGMKLSITSQTSTAAPLKFVNG